MIGTQLIMPQMLLEVYPIRKWLTHHSAYRNHKLIWLTCRGVYSNPYRLGLTSGHIYDYPNRTGLAR